MVDQAALLRLMVTNSIYVEFVAETDAADGPQLQNVKQDAQVMVKYNILVALRKYIIFVSFS